MTEREHLTTDDYEQIILEAEQYDEKDKALRERISKEVESTLSKPGGREKADDGWEIVGEDEE